MVFDELGCTRTHQNQKLCFCFAVSLICTNSGLMPSLRLHSGKYKLNLRFICLFLSFALTLPEEMTTKMAQQRQRYPIGTQTFSILREGGYVYVDKTDMVYDMTHDNSRYIFLSRPRRFGKSLLVSTLKSYFEGRKELFEGLAIEKLEEEWTQYPVLHFDMSTAKHVDKDGLERELNRKLCGYEKLYGRSEEDVDPNQRLQGLVEHAYEQTGQKVVVLIDEYDAPLLDVIHEEENLPLLRKVMRNFYSPLKYLDPYLRFVFLTGITKFSQLSIFSELNNIKNITMDEHYATLCGITEEEMLQTMRSGIERLAEKEELTYDGAVELLKLTYDGYHFCWPSPDIYNPFSLLNAMEDSKVDYYWFGSGTPTYLIEMLRKFEVSAEKIGGQYADVSMFDAPTETMTNSLPLLYQSGYVTIKDYDKKNELYLLDIPNHEVRIGLMNSLLPEYVTSRREVEERIKIRLMRTALGDGRIDDALTLLQTYLSAIPYGDTPYNEAHFESLLYVIFHLATSFDVRTQVRTAAGRMDMAVRTRTQIYLFELKFDGSAEEALQQIDVKNYTAPFSLEGLPIVKIGVNFSSKTRTIDSWAIERPE